ncbi:PREDICTED: zinc finger protein 784 [Condylura cristata]|uniref:zinc finger protein 784 n=1 Tax=Condylura cristata TaxID=143302 RepID=UPI00064368E9|nr:PREDICTED: zinc finger protein 784 [Condylura cristata]
MPAPPLATPLLLATPTAMPRPLPLFRLLQGHPLRPSQPHGSCCGTGLRRGSAAPGKGLLQARLPAPGQVRDAGLGAQRPLQGSQNEGASVAGLLRGNKEVQRVLAGGLVTHLEQTGPLSRRPGREHRVQLAGRQPPVEVRLSSPAASLPVGRVPHCTEPAARGLTLGSPASGPRGVPAGGPTGKAEVVHDHTGLLSRLSTKARIPELDRWTQNGEPRRVHRLPLSCPPTQVLVPDDGRPATPPSDLIEIQVVKVADATLAPEPPEPGSLHCALCPAAFRLVSDLLFHEHGHLARAEGGGRGGDPRRCHVCGHSCPGPASLRAHYSLHTGERPYRCPLCPRAFRALAPLLRHQRRHGPFRRSSDMRDHERVHTGERPYHCGVCGKGFTQSSVLSGHARIHTGERPFRCALCARTFNNSSNFRKHQRTHFHGPGPGLGAATAEGSGAGHSLQEGRGGADQ